MRVLYVTSEVFPLMKTGGLADVAAGLPAALCNLDIDVRLLIPGYPKALERAADLREVARLGNLIGCGEARLLSSHLPHNSVPVWLLDCPALYNRAGGAYQDEWGNDWNDNALRFAALDHAAVLIAEGSRDIAWRPDVIHGQDWHAGLTPVLMRDRPAPRAATMLTVHNLAYQGVFPLALLERLGINLANAYSAFEFHGWLSFLKAGIVFADALTTVSPTYAKEILTPEYGCGLDGVLRERADRLVGIMNGVEYGVWDPAYDPHLAAKYSINDLSGKRACKSALQQEMGLEVVADMPLIAFQSRLAHQKMPDTVLASLPVLLTDNVQFALVADGDAFYASAFRDFAARYPGRVAVSVGYQEPQAHRMLAGADILLHPSRYEPCGLGPIYALRYGTLPVVRRTGGMADSVVDTVEDTVRGNTATGFAFEHATAEALINCTRRALASYRNPIAWRKIQTQAMRQDFGWRRSAEIYADLYRALIADTAFDRSREKIGRDEPIVRDKKLG